MPVGYDGIFLWELSSLIAALSSSTSSLSVPENPKWDAVIQIKLPQLCGCNSRHACSCCNWKCQHQWQPIRALWTNPFNGGQVLYINNAQGQLEQIGINIFVIIDGALEANNKRDVLINFILKNLPISSSKNCIIQPTDDVTWSLGKYHFEL